jgi:hypothetical protein
MTVTEGKILTADTVQKYLEDRWEEVSPAIFGDVPVSLEGVQVTAIQGGNVNYAFCITLSNKRTIFLKQVSDNKLLPQLPAISIDRLMHQE